VAHQPAGPSLQRQLSGALARAARVQEESRALIDECLRLSTRLRDTVEAMHRDSEARFEAQPDKPALRNRQRDARRRSQQG
jgi:hypothetical protein